MKLFEAKNLLRKNGYKMIKEAKNESFVITVNISHTTTVSADMRTSSGRRTYYMNRKAFGINEGKMGSSKTGMIYRSAEKNSSWTWFDVKKLQELVKPFGLDVEEQHTQATVERDVDDEPVADYGNTSVYGENSNIKYYFNTTTSRTWSFKFTDIEGNGIKSLTEEDINEIEDCILESNPSYADDEDNYDVDFDVRM